MEKVLVVVHAFEDFEIGDMIIEDAAVGSTVPEEHRHKAVSITMQIPTGHHPEEI